MAPRQYVWASTSSVAGSGPVRRARAAAKASRARAGNRVDLEIGEDFEPESNDSIVRIVFATFFDGERGGDEGILVAGGFPPVAAEDLFTADIGVGLERMGDAVD